MFSKREILANLLEKTGLGIALSTAVGKWQGLVVFNYHRIGNSEGSLFDRALWSADETAFENQVKYLKANYDVISSDELNEDLMSGHGRNVMITFDDGYRDNYSLAYPILKQHNVPATFFITSGFIEERFMSWWDEIAWMVRSSSNSQLPASAFWNSLSLHPNSIEATISNLLSIYKKLGSDQKESFLSAVSAGTASGRCPQHVIDDIWMTWDMVREMDQNGMQIGGHTVTHPVLAYWDEAIQRHEIFDSKQRIEEELGHPITTFSYPVGQPDSFADETKRLLQEAGFHWGFSFFGGFSNLRNADHFDMPRVPVSSNISSALFQSTARLPWLFA